MDRQTDGRTDGQTDRRTRWTDRRTRWTDRRTDGRTWQQHQCHEERAVEHELHRSDPGHLLDHDTADRDDDSANDAEDNAQAGDPLGQTKLLVDILINSFGSFICFGIVTMGKMMMIALACFFHNSSVFK